MNISKREKLCLEKFAQKDDLERRPRRSDAEKWHQKIKSQKERLVLVAFFVSAFFAVLKLIRSLEPANGAGVLIAISQTIYTKRLECFRIL